MITIKEAADSIQTAILSGRKIPSRISEPVLRCCDGRLCMAFFVYFYDKDDYSSHMLRRPELWALADMETGELLGKYYCKTNDFSDAPLNKKIDCSDAAEPSPQTAQATQALFDELRSEYLGSGKLDTAKYELYLETLKSNVPSGYRRFYDELSGGFDEMKPNEPVAEPEEPAEEPVAEPAEEPVEEPAEPVEEPVNTPEPTPTADTAMSEDIAARLDELKELFEERIRYDEYKNKLFDNMHSELTKFRNGMADKILDSMALDVIGIIDIVKRTAANYSEKEANAENYKRLLNQVYGIAEDLTDVLYRQSIEPYNVNGDTVDVKRQKIAKVIETDDESLDKTVAQVVLEGYEKEGRVLRPERVNVYKFKK